MKKTILSFALLASSFIGFSQNTDDFKKFDIGPFEVIDKDHNYRLRDGVNILEYFELKTPMKKTSFQVDLFTNLSGFGTVWTYGVDFLWKRKISDGWFLNLGLAAASPNAKVGNTYYVSSYSFGIPITLEYVWGRNSLISGYIGFGVTPAWYHLGGFQGPLENGLTTYDIRGAYMSPRMDFGMYAPMGRHYLRVGILLERKIDLSNNSEKDRFYDCIGWFMPGINVGLVF